MSRRVAVVDVGSNSVRLLVSDLENERPVFVHTDKVMAQIGRSLGRDGRIDDEKIAEVARIVDTFVTDARRLGALSTSARSPPRRHGRPRTATSSPSGSTGGVGRGPRGDRRGRGGARLAFVGALASLEEPPAGDVGVVDVGGGSTEIVVSDGGRSFLLGSGRLSGRCDHPPRPFELARIREKIDATLPSHDDVHPQHGLAVAGSATYPASMSARCSTARRFPRALRLLSDGPSEDPPVPHRAGARPAASGRCYPRGRDATARHAALGLSRGIREGATLDPIRSAAVAMAKARPVPVDPEEPFGDAARRVLPVRARASSSSRSPACAGPTTSSTCTPCGSRRAGSGPCSRTSRAHFRNAATQSFSTS